MMNICCHHYLCRLNIFPLQIFDIIGFVYQYLKMLCQVSPQEWIFKELQNIGNMEFRFAEEQPQDDYAAELAGFFYISTPLYIF